MVCYNDFLLDVVLYIWVYVIFVRKFHNVLRFWLQHLEIFV